MRILNLRKITGIALAFMSVSIIPVFAEGEAAPSSNSWISMVVIYGAIIAAFYFLMIRPQKKKQKQEVEKRESVILGDEIVTIGGIVGRIINIKDEEITIETSIDKTILQFKKWAIKEVFKPESDVTK